MKTPNPYIQAGRQKPPLNSIVMHQKLTNIILIIISFLVIADNAISFDYQKDKDHQMQICEEFIKSVGGPCLYGSQESFDGRLSETHLNINGFILSKDSFSRAEKIFGEGSKWHSGDAASSEDKTCYISGEKNNEMAIIFAADREMSRGFVSSLTLIQGEVAFSNRCEQTKVSPRNIQTESGIYLGMTINRFKEIMGDPSGSNKGLLVYTYCEKKPYEPGETWCVQDGKSLATRCSGMLARFVDGKLTWFSISAGTDYYC